VLYLLRAEDKKATRCTHVPGQEVCHLPSVCPVVWCGGEDRLFILYTSGSTGAAKGLVHTLGGYMVAAVNCRLRLDHCSHVRILST
jgi:acyl-coenzyme A synthetase/AMP-(fatty) acid ligase